MSSVRYLEIDSEYRNRNQGLVGGLASSPANFIVEISQSGQKSVDQALDPLSNAAPKLAWHSSFDASAEATSLTLTAGGPVTIGSTSLSDRTTFLINAASGDLRLEDNYYVGAILTLASTTDGGATSVTYYRRITSYELITATQAKISIDTALPDGVVFTGGGTSGSINNPTNATNSATVPQLFIPYSPAINNYYAGCLVHLLSTTDTMEYRTITAFDATTHMATLDSTTGISWLNGGLNFAIVGERATETGLIPIADTTNLIGGVSSDRQAVQLASTAPAVNDIYNGLYLRLGQPTNVLSNNTAPYGEQRRIIDYTTLDGVQGSGSLTGAVVLSTGSSVDNEYVGLLLTIDTTGGGGANLETREITAYVGSTKTATVDITFSAISVNSDFFIRTAELETPFSAVLTAPGNNLSPGTYEIEQITRDNAVPFNYTGSLVSSSQMVCYELELINLILPNSILTTGGRIAFYPYVYVLLENISSASGRSGGLIYSNNPNATKMMFRASIDDTPTPLISPFIKIDGDGMVQTVKFKPNDSFRFAVFLPDGTLFQTVETDTSSPNPPNKLVQISALFSMKKL